MDIDAEPICMDWFPTAKGAQEFFALGCADGTFKMISRAGRVERTVNDAHQGAIIAIKWSYEGAALATAGDDGQIKVWSRGGMLRSQILNGGKSIYGICWNPENDSILYA